jgi:hypothetical protein
MWTDVQVPLERFQRWYVVKVSSVHFFPLHFKPAEVRVCIRTNDADLRLYSERQHPVHPEHARYRSVSLEWACVRTLDKRFGS